MSVVESQILVLIIRLTITKIRHYLNVVRNAKDLFEDPVTAIQQRVTASWGSGSQIDPTALQQFLTWFGFVSTIKNLPLDATPEDLIPTIKWAQEAKRHYLEFLKGAFPAQESPRWMRAILKLGRYSIASRVFVQLASDFPATFNPMSVEPVAAPAVARFSFSNESLPLTCVLRRVVGPSANEYLARLAAIWNVGDPQDHFRQACALNLTVHAEMQLVSFYDHNPKLRPSLRFIGGSKKSCYLCRMFITTHLESFTTSSCHQKIYTSWIPPPATNADVYQNYKTITMKLSKMLELTAKGDLESRLGRLKKPVPADSTAGVSLSGLTNLDLSKSPDSRATCIKCKFSETTPVSKGDLPRSEWPPINDMVIIFMRAGDTTRQDIVRIGDIVDPCTSELSWSKLVAVLSIDDGWSIGYAEERDFFLIDGNIRVRNERQFFACLQYLYNFNTMNAKADVIRY